MGLTKHTFQRRRSVALSASVLLIAAAFTIAASPAGAEASLDGCPHSQGFWKNHADLWPVQTLVLGDHGYDQAELLDLLEAPTKGDASMILGSQLIAAKLNVASGANASPFEAPVAEADDLLGPYEGALPYDVKNKRGPPSADRAAMAATAEALDRLNNDDAPEACGSQDPSEPPTTTASNVAVSADGFMSSEGRPTFDINVTSTGTDPATNVTLTFNVSGLPGTSWALLGQSADPPGHLGNLTCPSVDRGATWLAVTCEVGLDMSPGDWVDLWLRGSGWDGQALDLTVEVTADVDSDLADSRATASLGT